MFRFEEEPVSHNLLTYWAMVSIARSLRFAGEARHTYSPTLQAFAAYYSLFHLGAFLELSASHHLDTETLESLETQLEQGEKDPRKAIGHGSLQKTLDRWSRDFELPESVPSLLRAAWKLRVFSNYGPDVRWSKAERIFRIDNTRHNPDEVSLLMSDLDEQFHAAVAWVARNGLDKGAYVPIAIDLARSFFVDNQDGAPYFAVWSSPGVLDYAERLREELYRVAKDIVYVR